MTRALATIGYQGASVPELIRALRQAGVTRLVDVRALPLSRRPGFSKNVLARHLAEAGIAYTHLKPLGTPKPGRDAAKAGDIEGMRSIFSQQLKTPEAKIALDALSALAQEESVCLLCWEADHQGCHRDIVAARIRRRTKQKLAHLHPEPLALRPEDFGL